MLQKYMVSSSYWLYIIFSFSGLRLVLELFAFIVSPFDNTCSHGNKLSDDWANVCAFI